MPDQGTQYTDKMYNTLTRRIEKTFLEAQRDISKKIKEYTKKYEAADKQKRAQMRAGLLTQAQYNAWKQGQIFIGQQWQAKADSIASTLLNANRHATAMIEGAKRAVFGENATFQAYSLENDAHLNLSFGIYDSATVTRILRDRPELLPRRTVDGVKDRAWNKTKIANAVTQSIVQGESISELAARIARDTASANDKAMLRYARTAMTGAQNAGRLEVMREAQGMGIKVKKLWIAVLDDRTRDAHAELDGQTANVNEPFENEYGPIMYPGDPSADEANIWNCRCALGYEYEEYPNMYTDRIAYNEYFDEEGDYHRESYIIPDMTYSQWKAVKSADNPTEIYKAKEALNIATNLAILNDANRVFTGIWKEDVTYADYEEKQNSGAISRKRAYFMDQMDKAQRRGDDDAYEKFKKLFDTLNEFEDKGYVNSQLLKDRQEALKTYQDLLPRPEIKGPFNQEAYIQARKDAALWDTPEKVDDALRAQTGDTWINATDKERDAIYEYTRSYHKYNEPLRGIEYGTSEYKGVGNTDLNAKYANNGERLNAMTSILDKSTYTQDVWLQRGVGFNGMDKFFNVDINILRYGTENELQDALLGKNVTEYGFMSCGTAKGQGFSSNPIVMNIYAPSGTKMMYVEPISAYGNGDGKSWDGKSTQHSYGSEFETIIQQGTRFEIVKVERANDGTIYIDMDVVNQDNQQLYKP